MPPQAIPVDTGIPEVILVSSPPAPAVLANAVPAPGLSRCEQAAAVLEKAVQGSNPDPSIAYMLALAYKRQGKTNEARTALRKIAKPDADVVLQMGLLSLADNNLAQAEEDFARAWSMDPASYEICYNLLLTQLTLGKDGPVLELIPRAIELLDQRNGSNQVEDRRFLQILHALLKSCRELEGYGRPEPLLAELQPADEQRLLRVIRSLGQIDAVHSLLRKLAEARPRSAPVREAYVEAVLVKGKELIDRCLWTEAELLLRPLARERGFSRSSQIALYNLLGCCSCLTQDFDGALKSFSAALKLSPNDPRLQQNLALTYELQGDLGQADPHWGRYFDLLGDQVPVPPDVPRYLERLSYEGLTRLSSRYSEKEKWSVAISYMHRAVQLRANDPECLEQLFYLYKQAKRYPDARRTLEQLRRLQPDEPQYELCELDLIEVKGLNDIEKILAEIDRMRKRHPGDLRVEERAMKLVSDIIPIMVNLCEHLTENMGKVIDQVRHLPNYQINWAAVREVMRDLLKEFQKLRRITGKCLPLVSNDEARRIIRDLSDHIDKKMEACRSMGG
jgi:Flp pilus assembly protein TadD